MSLGEDIITKSSRLRAIIGAALRTASDAERALIRAELARLRQNVCRELLRIPPEFSYCDYQRRLVAEGQCIDELIKRVAVYLFILGCPPCASNSK